MQQLTFHARTAYGRVRYYPQCDQAKAIISVTGKTTLNKSELELLKTGFVINLETDPATRV